MGMDIRRIKVDEIFRYVDKNTKKRIKISKKKNDKVQAIGTDDAGRKQYIYSKKFVKEQQEIKFKDLIEFGKRIKRIRKNVKKNIIKKGNIYDKEKIISIII